MTILTPPITTKVQPQARARVKWDEVFLFSLLAIIMRLFVSREGLQGSLGLWRPWRYYRFTVTMNTFAYTWLAVASHNSALLASIFHGSFNWSGNRLRSFMVLDTLFPIGLLMGAVWFLVVLVVYGVFKRSPQVNTDLLRMEQEERL